MRKTLTKRKHHEATNQPCTYSIYHRQFGQSVTCRERQTSVFDENKIKESVEELLFSEEYPTPFIHYSSQLSLR